MAKQDKTFRINTTSPKLARALDQAWHIDTVNIVGTFASKAAFIRALRSSPVGRNWSEGAAREWMSEGTFDENLTPGVLYAEPDTSPRADGPIPIAPVVGE